MAIVQLLLQCCQMDCCCSQLCVVPVISASHARHTLAPELVRTFQILKHLYNDEENDADLGLYDAFKADAWGVGAILYYAATGQHLNLAADAAAPAAAMAAAKLQLKVSMHQMGNCQLTAQVSSRCLTTVTWTWWTSWCSTTPDGR